ncbi:SAM-dependent methyltransferase [Vibrio panuliri]|uniref:SAM-dependent methyltransferase n=1 Tax=Vibrio panuliri TaxID=1381081 RepID=A0A1Q9HJM4_9VIBR|nr:methyltransferase [Vibrio panuliri]OLQ90532.1 SAM-dependent methyltransferase [Vibrio panuliri]
MQNLFHSIDTYLTQYQDYWRFEPFFASKLPHLPWLQHNPSLCEWLSQLTPQQVEYYKQNGDALTQACAPFFPELIHFLEQLRLPQVSLSGLQLERGIDTGVPGRKLQQILAMGESALQLKTGTEWLEWCSGKGFLGRILASQSQQKVTSFEFQQALCESGQAEAIKQKLPMQFIQGDAFAEESIAVFNRQQHAVALHACGDLHVSLIDKAVKCQLPAISLSPCCYHLIQSESYQALSQPAKQSALRLSKSELRIPLQELVTGGERVKRHRLEEMSYRLGFDILLQEKLALSEYVPIPSIKKSQLSEGFESFCHWAATEKDLVLPAFDSEEYLAKGELRFWRMEKLSLVQQLFKRGLELWLVLDKAIYLQQHGYQVTLREFCGRDVTPRNILLQANRQAD